MATKLIVGLGNPGIKYRFTRHNIGFLAVRHLAKKHALPLRKRKFNSLLGEGSIEGKKVALALPLTFMNLSGSSVFSLVKWKGLGTEDIVIICDDINLPLGTIRLRRGGGDGGHKGLRSVIDSLGDRDFPRLRVGIAGSVKSRNLESFVLSPFNRKEQEIVKQAIERAAEASLVWVKEGIEAAMNRFNVSETTTPAFRDKF